MTERRPFIERLTCRLVPRPFGDPAGDKGWLTRPARPQPHALRRYAVSVPGWPKFERPLRIVLVTDLHVGSHSGDVARFAALAAEVNALEPDLALLGGDYINMQVFGGGRVPPDVIAGLLAPIRGRHGRFAILGNHDYMYGADEVALALRQRGIVVLDHERRTVSFDAHTLDIVGVPDAHIMRARTRDLVTGLAPERPTIVLSHDPVWFAEVPRGPFLTLAGHTHGGQIKLPGVGILTNASAAPLRWSHGLVIEDGRHLVVSAGLGTSVLPLRIGVPPELVVIEATGA